MSRDKPIVIEAHRFVLRGTGGQKLAMLTTNDDNEAYLSFFGRQEQPKIAIGVTKDNECRMVFLDDDGNARINIAFLPNGQAAIMAMGGPGKPSVGIRGGWDEGCGVAAIGGNGSVRISLGIDRDGYPDMCVLNPDGNVVWKVPLRPEGTRVTKGGLHLPDGPRLG